MAEIRAFRALRYEPAQAGKIEELVCPPYDIISEPQRKAYLERNSRNVIRLELPKEELPGGDAYQGAKAALEAWLAEGALTRDMDEGMYIYQQVFTGPDGQEKALKGLICLVRVEDFSSQVVLPHEETLSKAKEDRFHLLQATHCNFSQIYSLYRDENHTTAQRMDRLAESCSPRVDFTQEGVTQRLWVVNDPVALEGFREDFAGRKLYIADGHHRYETAINFRNFCRESGMYLPGSEYVMMLLSDMGDPGLVVFPTHRLLHHLPDFQPARLLEACAPYFHCTPVETLAQLEEEMAAHQEEKAFGFCVGDQFTLLVLKDKKAMEEVLPEKSPAYRLLDVSILHSLILERLLGIDQENMANQKNLTYTRDLEEAVEAAKTGTADCAFLLNPTAVSEIGDVASAGEKMPQKSTYFYPKAITGLVMNQMDECRPN